MDDGDGKMVTVPPTNDTFTHWGTTFRAVITYSSLDVYPQFHVFPFVHLYRFLESQEFCDVIFQFACGGIYKDHRVVLCLDNAYFQALFRSSLKETLKGIVDIADIPYQLFVDVMHYLYTGIIPQSYCSTAGFESLGSLCELANRYESVNLLRYCERLIIGRLNVCNMPCFYTSGRKRSTCRVCGERRWRSWATIGRTGHI